MALPAPQPGRQPLYEDSVPPLNNYVRSRLSKAETLTFAACASALANLPAGDNEGSKEITSKVVPRMVLFGALPPSILPVLLSVRTVLDMPKTGDRKLLRVVNYLIQLASGEGSAGTVVPFSPLTGSATPMRATDQFEYDDLSKLWTDVLQEHATMYQRAAAFRALAAVARASLTTNPDDTTLVAHLMAAAATTLDRVEAVKRGKLPFFGSSKKGRELDRRQTLERVAAQRMALSSARVGLPRVVLSMKIAPRAFQGVNSIDPLCARHALALAALVARENPVMYTDQLTGLLNGNLNIFQSTGSLSKMEEAAAAAGPPGAAADAVAAGGAFKPLRPAREVFQERSINLVDPWARVYLARGCGAVLQAARGRGGAAEDFWRALTICACCDQSTIVTLEAIKALAGAPYPSAIQLRPSSSTQKWPALDERKELEDGVSLTAGWRMLLAYGDEEVPGAVPQMQALAAFAKQFSATRSQRGVQQSASLKRLASMISEPSAESSSSSSGATAAKEPGTILATIVQRLLACLAQMSHALVCSTTRAVAVLAEARGRAVAAARTPEEKVALLGDAQVQLLMKRLEDRMRTIASDPEFSAHQRVKALEALLWFQPLPARNCAGLTPQDVVQWMSTGGGTVSPVVAVIFADPWPEDAIASFLSTIMRRLYSCPGAAEYLLSLSTAIASVCPSRVRMEQLQQMWDTCLRANNTEVKLTAVQAALELMGNTLPPICSPPSAAAPEVKAVASREEAARWAQMRSATWWLGENINFAANEFAWQPRLPPGAMLQVLMRADEVEQGQLASAAAAANPLLAMVLARLQRALLGSCWEVRMAAAQAVAKVAVRSGEPFRVQAYSILASTCATVSSTGGGGGGAGSVPVNGTGARSSNAASGGNSSGSLQRLIAGLPQVGDPLGVAAAVGPALEVLDAMYSGEVVVQELIGKYGRNRKKWPRKLLDALHNRNTALAAAICERVGFVPKDLLWPLGETAKQLLTGKIEYTEEELEEKRKRREAKAAAAAKAGAAAASAAGSSDEEEEVAKDEEEEPDTFRRYADSSDASPASSPRHGMLDKLQGYDFNPNDDSYSVVGEEQADYPDSISVVGEQVPSDDDSVVHRQQGTVLYDFTPEEADEVSVQKGDQVEVEYEMGGWLHVITRNGSAGLVPRSYVHIKEEDDDNSDVLSLAGRSSVAGSSVSGYGSLTERSSMRMKPRTSIDADSSVGGAPYRAQQLGRKSSSWVQRGLDAQAEESEDDAGVDPMLVAQQMGRVNQEHAEVQRASEQVEEMATSTRVGGLFNQPQYLHLKEQLNRSLQHLEGMQVSSTARSLRRQVEQQALAALDQLEALRRIAMGGAAGSSPNATPRTLSLRERQPSTAGSVVSTGGAYEGAGEVYEYTPSKAAVMYKFEAAAEGELDVDVGDVVYVEAEVDGWYSVRRERDDARGLVPASYVELEGFT